METSVKRKKVVVNLKNAEKHNHRIIIETILEKRKEFKGLKFDFRIMSTNFKKCEYVGHL
jgi:hypothetical protein